MPIFDFRCRACGQIFESMNAARPACLNCGNELVDKMLSAPSVRIKGQMPKDGSGGMDQYTADTLGIPLKELPSGLRTKKEAA